MEIRIVGGDHEGDFVLWEVWIDGQAVVGGNASTWERAWAQANDARLAEVGRTSV